MFNYTGGSSRRDVLGEAKQSNLAIAAALDETKLIPFEFRCMELPDLFQKANKAWVQMQMPSTSPSPSGEGWLVYMTNLSFGTAPKLGVL
jgi:hypothetical protein